MKSQHNARMLAASMAEVSNFTKDDDDELTPMAVAALTKLHKNGMQWNKLTDFEIFQRAHRQERNQICCSG